MQSPDHEIWLWNEIRYGNERALYQLYMHSYDHLFRYGLHTTADQEKVMECINEVFTEIWSKRERLPDVKQVQGYLFIIFKRKLSHHTLRKLPVFLFPEEKLYGVQQEERSYEEMLIAMQTEDEMKTRIRHALDKLTPRQKELIRLKYYEGLTSEDIADKLQISLRTIYNTIHSAISVLRKEL